MSLDLTPTPAAYVDIGDNLPFCQNQPAATVMGWVELDGIGVVAFLSLSINNGGAGSNSSRIAFELNGSAEIFLYGRATDGGAASQLDTAGLFSLSAGVKHHLAAVVDIANDFMAIYVDGVLIKSSTPSFAPTTFPNTTTDSNAFGATDLGDARFPNGRMADWRLYHRTLDAKEIASIHGSCGLDTIRDTMHFRYLFDDPNPGPETLGTAAAANEIGTEAFDRIGIAGAGIVCEVSDQKYVSTGMEAGGTLDFAPKLTRSLRRPA